ncbi:MAG: PKD domain-containing protein [Anaerolineales bacterium]
MFRWTLLASLLLSFLAPLPAAAQGISAPPSGASAQEGLGVAVTPSVFCADVDFEVNATGGSGAYDLAWEFGDTEALAEPAVATMPHTTSHTYPSAGVYTWSLMVTDSAEALLTASASADVAIGPQVELTSNPFPPLLELEGGTASLELTAQVEGGSPPYTYAFDLDGDGTFESASTEPTATVEFTAAADTTLGVQVTDDCGLVAVDTLNVVVVDPEDQQGCHPMAQRIADAVSGLFPTQAEQLYSCEDIFNFFTGGLFEGLTGEGHRFGILWRAYNMATMMPDLTWEQIVDWKMNMGGWGLLLQLQRAADALGEGTLLELYELATSGEHSLTDIRHALRAAVQFGADIEEALAMVEGGTSPGGLMQFYRLSEDLGLESSELAAFLEGGASLSDVRHAARMAEQFGGDWMEIAEAHGAGESWGSIGQAYRLADETTSAAEILEMGVSEFRQSQHEGGKPDAAGYDMHMASRIADQFEVTIEEVMAQFQGACDGDWSCVRASFRGQGGAAADSDVRTATRIAERYGISVEQVMLQLEGACGGNWSCVRAYFRELFREPHGGGRP